MKQKFFVANRLREIPKSSKSSKEHYIPTNQNLGDYGTRGLEPNELCSKWLLAPDFLIKRYCKWISFYCKLFSVHTTTCTSTPTEPVL